MLVVSNGYRNRISFITLHFVPPLLLRQHVGVYLYIIAYVQPFGFFPAYPGVESLFHSGSRFWLSHRPLHLYYTCHRSITKHIMAPEAYRGVLHKPRRGPPRNATVAKKPAQSPTADEPASWLPPPRPVCHAFFHCVTSFVAALGRTASRHTMA